MSDPFYTNGRGNATPTFQGALGDIKRELRRLWQRIEQRDTDTTVYQQHWSYAGIVAPAATTYGARWQVPTNIRMANVTLTLVTASSTNYSVTMYSNGSSVGVVTLAAGATSAVGVLNVFATAGSFIHPALAAASSGSGVALGITLSYFASNEVT